MSRSKKGKVVSMPAIEEGYFKSGRARKLPIHECLIFDDWKTAGYSLVILSRRHENGNISSGFFYVDTFCLGLKDTGHAFHLSVSDYEDFKKALLDGNEMIPAEYPLAHSLIYGAIDQARYFGFEPHKEFKISKYILEAREHAAMLKRVLGQNGRPIDASGSGDDAAGIAPIPDTLGRTAGKGNFDLLRKEDEDEDWAEDEDDEEGGYTSGRRRGIGGYSPEQKEANLVSIVSYHGTFVRNSLPGGRRGASVSRLSMNRICF